MGKRAIALVSAESFLHRSQDIFRVSTANGREFVYNFCRQKLSRQRGPAFVEEHSYLKLQVQQSEDLERSDAATIPI